MGRIEESLLARIMVMILNKKLRRLISLKSLKDGLWHLDIRDKRKKAEALRSLPKE